MPVETVTQKNTYYRYEQKVFFCVQNIFMYNLHGGNTSLIYKYALNEFELIVTESA